MADRAKKLSELPTATTVVNNDIFIIVANTAGVATTKQISVNNFKAVFSSVVVPTANTTTSGTIKVASGMVINATGFLNANINYANSTVHGVVAAGNNVYINANGYLGVFGANTTELGVVQVGNNLTVSASSLLSVSGANTTTRGVVQVGSNLTVDANAVLSVSNNLIVSNLQVSTVTSNLIPHTANSYQLGNTSQYWRSLHVDGFTVNNGGAAPANSTSAGVSGQFAFDISYVYLCVANNTWKRAALSTW